VSGIGNPRIGDAIVVDGKQYAVVGTFVGKDRTGAESGVVMVGDWDTFFARLFAIPLPLVRYDTEQLHWVAVRPSGFVVVGGPPEERLAENHPPRPLLVGE